MNTDAKFADVKQLTVEGTANARKFADDAAGKTRAIFDQTVAQATQATSGLAKVGEEAAEFGRGNLDAMTRSAQATMAGLQDYAKHTIATMQAMTEQTLETAKAVAGAKSLKEAADLQAAFLRTALDRAMAEQAKLQDVAVKTAEAAFAPLTARMSVAMDRASRHAA